MSEPDDAIDGWLDAQIHFADNSRHESHQLAPNSYGAGYDQGRYDGLRDALAKLLELWESGDAVGGSVD